MKTKTYVITGSTSGIGKSLIQKLAEDNIIFAGYRDEAKRAEIEKISSDIFTFYVDYAKPETIQQAINYIKSKVSKIDSLINVAGCVVAGPIEKIEMSELRRQFNVNVFGHLELSRGLLDLLDGGRIINISSMASYGIFPFIAPYCATKRCLDMFFNSLLLETKRNIKVISVKPGVIATPLWEKSIKENSKYFDHCTGFEKEMQFMIKNAQRNAKKGLSVDKVVEAILKADSASNPRLTYTVGRDAFGARLFAKLPTSFANKLITLGLKLRIK